MPKKMQCWRYKNPGPNDNVDRIRLQEGKYVQVLCDGTEGTGNLPASYIERHIKEGYLIPCEDVTIPGREERMSLRRALYRNCPGLFFISKEGWIVKTSNEGDGTFIDPKSQTTRWTGHNGDKLSEEILNTPVKEMQDATKW